MTKRQRRAQLARARAQRLEQSHARREARRRRVQAWLTALAVLVAVGALTAWIITRDDGAAALSGFDYDAVPAVRPTTPIEVSR